MPCCPKLMVAVFLGQTFKSTWLNQAKSTSKLLYQHYVFQIEHMLKWMNTVHIFCNLISLSEINNHKKFQYVSKTLVGKFRNGMWIWWRGKEQHELSRLHCSHKLQCWLFRFRAHSSSQPSHESCLANKGYQDTLAYSKHYELMEPHGGTQFCVCIFLC